MPVWRALFWLAVISGVVLALWPQPDPKEPWFLGFDKVEHALSFTLLAWLGVRAGYQRMWLLAAGLLCLGGAIELAQGFTETRSADWLDWLADAAGVAAGWAVVRLQARLSGTKRSLGLEQEHGR